MRINGYQRTPWDNGSGERDAEKDSQVISAKRTGLEKKWTREYSPAKSIPAKRKKATIDGPRKKCQ